MENNPLPDIKFRVVYSRRRSIGITIKPDSSVTVHAPYRTSAQAIEKLVLSKSRWILRHIESFKNHVRINGNKTITDGSIVYFRGREHRVELNQSSKTRIEASEGKIAIFVKDPSDNEKLIKALDNWFKSVAESEIRNRFSLILASYQEYNFKPAGLKIRSLKRRWGSCSSKGVITLNSDLIRLNEVYLDYVILHELCHLKHLNHGKEYYSLLTELFPEWKEVRKEIRKYII